MSENLTQVYKSSAARYYSFNDPSKNAAGEDGQVMDGVAYGLELYQKLVASNQALPFKSNWRTFAYGYSQGGAVALAVHRYIEQNDLSEELRFRGSICGDGPYDLIATLRYYLEDDGKSYDTSTTSDIKLRAGVR